ncbi:hypothetical protein ACFQLX_18920, partial [Streptomyces polyrhachis]
MKSRSLEAGWIGSRLRTARGAALALGVLVFLAAFLAAAFPRAMDTYQDTALRDAVERSSPEQRSLVATVDHRLPGRPGESPAWAPLAPQDQEQAVRDILAGVHAPARITAADVSYGVRSSAELTATDPWLPRPGSQDPRFQLDARADLGEHTEPVAGALPRGEAEKNLGEVLFQAAVTEATARALRIRVGSELHFTRITPDKRPPTVTVRITGIVRPLRAKSDFWTMDPLLAAPRLTDMPVAPGSPGLPPRIWRGALLLPPESGPSLFAELGAEFLPEGNTEPQVYWQLPFDTRSLAGRDAELLRKELVRVLDGPGLEDLRAKVSENLEVKSGLPPVLETYTRLRAAVVPVVAVAAFGVGTTGAVVVLMSGGLSLVRREAELRLLRSRGGSLKGIAGRLALETAAAALPAAAAGLALAVALLPDGRLLPALLAVAALAAL